MLSTNERGFALPTTIFLVALLTVMLAASLTRATAEHEIAASGSAVVEALNIANGGLHTYFATETQRPQNGDSTRINLPGGYAWVVNWEITQPPDTNLDHMFVVRSTGYVLDPNQGSTPLAQRTVAQLAYWQTGHLSDSLAVMTAANGVTKSGGGADVLFSGVDICPSSSFTRTGLRTDTLTSLSGITSSSAVLQDSLPEIVAETGLDWERLRSGDFNYDFTSITNLFLYSTYYIDGDLVTSGGLFGTGLLVVTGDLITRGWKFMWFGPVLVGGRIVAESGNTSDPSDPFYNTEIWGLLVTGLNADSQPPPNQVGLHPFNVRHCANSVQWSLKNSTGFVPVAGTWIDNWATY